MKPFVLGCLGFLVIPVLVIVAVGAVAPHLPPALAARSSLAAPVQVGTWSAPGSDLTTPPITLAGSSARLDYRIAQIKGGSIAQLCVYVRKRDGSLGKADCLQENGTTQLYLPPGAYYLEVRSTSGPWSLTLTDLP